MQTEEIRRVTLAVVGAGPAGLTFARHVLDGEGLPADQVIVLDSVGTPCSRQREHSLYVSNSNSVCPENLRHLVDGTKRGPEIAEHFGRHLTSGDGRNLALVLAAVTKIRRARGGFELWCGERLVAVADEVALATGVLPKQIPLGVWEGSAERCDWTARRFSEIQAIDFCRHELIFIGSGDNALSKAGRLAAWIESAGVPHRPGCVKIFTKGGFRDNCNPALRACAEDLATRGTLEVRDGGPLLRLAVGREGAIERIDREGDEYVSEFEGGAYVSVHIGFEPRLPRFVGCSADDSTLLGDLALAREGRPCTVYDAAQDAERKAADYVDRRRLANWIEEEYGFSTGVTLERFVPSTTKFVTGGHHFKLRADGQRRFVKRYGAAHLVKVAREVAAMSRVRGAVRVPSIIAPKGGGAYVQRGDEVVVLYDQVDGVDLKEGSATLAEFFGEACAVEAALASMVRTPTTYDFDAHFERFARDWSSVRAAVAGDARPFAARDMRYLEFLDREAASVRERLAGALVPERFVHGDLLPQNMVRNPSGSVWVVDWEKSGDYLAPVDVMRAVMFAIFDPARENFGLSAAEFGRWARHCFDRLPLERSERGLAAELYYMHLITNVDFLRRLYVEQQDLRPEMAGEDFQLCRWFKEARAEIQAAIDA